VGASPRLLGVQGASGLVWWCEGKREELIWLWWLAVEPWGCCYEDTAKDQDETDAMGESDGLAENQVSLDAAKGGEAVVNERGFGGADGCNGFGPEEIGDD